MTKNTVRNANNAVVIEDIFDVFSRHVDQMSSYSALLAPLSDYNKIYNFRNGEDNISVMQEIEHAWERCLGIFGASDPGYQLRFQGR